MTVLANGGGKFISSVEVYKQAVIAAPSPGGFALNPSGVCCKVAMLPVIYFSTHHHPQPHFVSSEEGVPGQARNDGTC